MVDTLLGAVVCSNLYGEHCVGQVLIGDLHCSGSPLGMWFGVSDHCTHHLPHTAHLGDKRQQIGHSECAYMHFSKHLFPNTVSQISPNPSF